MTTDAQLIDAARDDPDAFADLYRRHVQLVHIFLRGRLPEHVAGELTAETFAQAALSLRRFRDLADGSALPWLYGIARNLTRAYYEHERVERRARERLGMPLHAYELDLEATTDPRHARARLTLTTPERGHLMATDLEAIGHHLHALLGRRIANRRRRRRRVHVGALAAASVVVFATVAIASGIGSDLQLDPTKWSVLGGGSVDDGQGAYVHAKRVDDGSSSTFLVEHDANLAPYLAFLLHEKTLAAANATSPTPVRIERGALCTPAEVTRAEAIALSTLRAQFPAGTKADASGAVDTAVQAAFASAPCRGLDYAGEQARLTYAGVQPATKLMPGAR